MFSLGNIRGPPVCLGRIIACTTIQPGYPLTYFIPSSQETYQLAVINCSSAYQTIHVQCLWGHISQPLLKHFLISDNFPLASCRFLVLVCRELLCIVHINVTSWWLQLHYISGSISSNWPVRGLLVIIVLIRCPAFADECTDDDSL